MEPIRVVLAADHPLVGAGVHILETARHLFKDLAPDILLIEMTLADELEPPLAEPATTAPAPTQVFVLRGYHNRAYVFGLLAGGSASGLTEHDALQTIAEAIQAGLDGDMSGRRHRIVAKLPTRQLGDAHATMPDLTARERDVLRQLTMGKSDWSIGEHLGISKSTVRYHLQNIYLKLRVTRRSEAIVWAVQTGLDE
jgi:DNA-binding NarL/FixJ family response regulator